MASMEWGEQKEALYEKNPSFEKMANLISEKNFAKVIQSMGVIVEKHKELFDSEFLSYFSQFQEEMKSGGTHNTISNYNKFTTKVVQRFWEQAGNNEKAQSELRDLLGSF